MSNIERFFHIRGRGPKGGATVRVVGNDERVGQVDVQVVECSRMDNFNKAKGRELAAHKPIKVVPLRYLPHELARIEDRLVAHKRIRPVSEFAHDYTFAVKYFLPKE